MSIASEPPLRNASVEADESPFSLAKFLNSNVFLKIVHLEIHSFRYALGSLHVDSFVLSNLGTLKST